MEQPLPPSKPAAMPLLLAEKLPPTPADSQVKKSLVAGFIPYKNPRALIAYYCAIFGLVPVVGLILGPAAIIFGIFGATYAEAHPQTKGMYHALLAIVLGTFELTAHIVVPLTLVIFFPADFLQEILKGILPFLR
jgi:hypothetical protein